ncbi:MAG: VTT domain-containing protein [Candidatus Paceibacterota bacterium]
MPDLNLASLVPWIIAHGYFLFFVTAVIEGTLVTVAAGVAAGLGYYNIFIIILIAIIGDLTADIVYYLIGYRSRILIIERYGHYIGVTKERIEKIEKMVHRHFRKTMIVVKLSPILPIPGLIAMGVAHVPLRKFIGMSLLITVPKAIFFSLLGFYSIKTYMYLTTTIQNGSYILGGIILLIFVVYFTYQKIAFNFVKNNPID